MNKDKLESLRRLAADERTPVEEARNAALVFVRGGGQADVDVVTLEDLARAREQLAAMTRLRSILTRLMDARKAEELAGKVRAQAEQEARDALGGEEKKPETGEAVASKPAGGWRPSPFGTYVKMF